MSPIILLADVSPTIQKVLRLALSDSPYDLHIVDNGVDAVRMAQELSPSLVLADVLLPQKNGYQVCDEVKSRFGIPVILLYGAFENVDEAKLQRVGADGSLKKPFATQELFRLIRELIGSKMNQQSSQLVSNFEERIMPGSGPGFGMDEILSQEFANERSFEPNPGTKRPTTQTPQKKKKDDIDLSYLDEELNLPPKDKGVPKDRSKIVEDTFSVPPIISDVRSGLSHSSLDSDETREMLRVMASEIIERIAWEVIPQVAERVIKAELKKLLDEVE